ncbi:hypothetical protein QAD02_020615 [Eretmocerus hayati]|uniref:Uncharacterized protein n=1 Tax=Eretmocerus hayati TaxID=131215 RepID=A0ACC2PR45_9HYME|nr:hypothetical protein QAD02_020615 [Eretmocerus hayati]
MVDHRKRGKDVPARPNKKYRTENKKRYDRLRRLIFIERLDYVLRWEDIVRGSDDEILEWVRETVRRQRCGQSPPPRPLARHLRPPVRPSQLQARSHGFSHLPEPNERPNQRSPPRRPSVRSETITSGSIANSPISTLQPSLIPLDQAIAFFDKSSSSLTQTPQSFIKSLPSPQPSILPPLQGVAQSSIDDHSSDLIEEPPRKRVKYEDYSSRASTTFKGQFKYTKEQVREEYRNRACLKEIRETQPRQKRSISPIAIPPARAPLSVPSNLFKPTKNLSSHSLSSSSTHPSSTVTSEHGSDSSGNRAPRAEPCIPAASESEDRSYPDLAGPYSLFEEIAADIERLIAIPVPSKVPEILPEQFCDEVTHALTTAPEQLGDKSPPSVPFLHNQLAEEPAVLPGKSTPQRLMNQISRIEETILAEQKYQSVTLRSLDKKVRKLRVRVLRLCEKVDDIESYFGWVEDTVSPAARQTPLLNARLQRLQETFISRKANE